MTDLIHIDVIDNGLATLIGTTLNACITQTEPLVLNDCSNASGSGGKRIVSENAYASGEITLVQGDNANSRKLIFPPKKFTDAVLADVDIGVADYWLAVYDGTRILYKTNRITARTIAIGGTVISATLEYEIRQL